MAAASQSHHPPYRPATLDPSRAAFGNVLSTRVSPWRFQTGTARCAFAPALLSPPFSPACLLRFAIGNAEWTVALGSADVILLHPALAEVTDAALLPLPVREAVLELLTAPLADSLGALMGTSIRQTACVFPDEHGTLPELAENAVLCSLRVTRTDAAREFTVPCAVAAPDREALLALLPALENLPGRGRIPPSEWTERVLALPIPVAVQAGSMSLSVAQCAGIGVGDILLPERYPAAAGEVRLVFSTDFVSSGAAASCEGQKVTITGFFKNPPAKETRMSEPSPPVGKNTVLPEELPVTLSFELEQRLLEVRDIMALTPGYTFMLDVDPQGPVSLRANGKIVGSGRLVDINGTLGVQVVRVDP